MQLRTVRHRETMKRLYFPLILLAIALFGLACSKSPEEKMATLWETVHQQLNDYQFDAARQSLGELAAQQPNVPFDIFGEALIQEHQMRFMDAMADYMALVDQQPNFEPARSALWRSLAWKGFTDDALRTASDWLAAYPGSQDAAMAMVQSLLAAKQYERARALVDSAVALGLEPATASMIRAYSHRLQFHFDTASHYADTPSEIPADDHEYFRWAADYFEADQQFDSALVLSHKSWAAANGDWSAFWHHFHRLLRLDDRRAARQLIADFEAAGRPEYIIAWLRMKYYTATGDVHQAKREGVLYTRSLEQGISTLRTELIFTRNANDQLSAEGNSDAILGIIESQELPPKFEALVIFDMLYQLKDTRPTNDFLNQLKKVPEEYRDLKGFKITEFSSLHNTGQLDAFADMRRELRSSHGGSADWLVSMADVHAQSSVKDFDIAYEMYLDALEVDRWYYPALEHNVDMLLSRERAGEAAKLFELYPYFVDSLPQAAVLRARVMIHNKQVDDALTLVENRLDPISMVIDNYYALDSALRLTVQYDGRSKLVNVMTTLADGNPDVLAAAAEIALENEEYERALELADQSLAIDPALLSPAVTKAWAAFQTGKKAEAFEQFVNNAVANRNDMRNNMYYSRALAIEGRETDRAGNLARMAVFESGGSLETRLNLSLVYYHIGRVDLSYGEAVKATRLAAGSAEAWFRLGVAQHERGSGDAVASLEKAIKLGLRGDDLNTARQILGS